MKRIEIFKRTQERRWPANVSLCMGIVIDGVFYALGLDYPTAMAI